MWKCLLPIVRYWYCPSINLDGLRKPAKNLCHSSGPRAREQNLEPSEYEIKRNHFTSTLTGRGYNATDLYLEVLGSNIGKDIGCAKVFVPSLSYSR
jgi:hypothetical protein